MLFSPLLTPNRFSCCSKVFPCDKYEPVLFGDNGTDTYKPRCHDAEADHPNEHANRMIWYDALTPMPYIND